MKITWDKNQHFMRVVVQQKSYHHGDLFRCTLYERSNTYNCWTELHTHLDREENLTNGMYVALEIWINHLSKRTGYIYAEREFNASNGYMNRIWVSKNILRPNGTWNTENEYLAEHFIRN